VRHHLHFHYRKQDDRWTVRVTGNWRLTWRWENGACDVDIEDYH
jgi:toxin HigB-1